MAYTRAEISERYRLRHPNKVRAYRKSVYARDRKNILERRREYGLSRHGKFISYKQNARSRGLGFFLTEEEFLSFWGTPCHYCGDEVLTIGLDRVDNSRGYSMDNVVSCHEFCNKMKLTLSHDEFVSVCRKVAARFPK